MRGNGVSKRVLQNGTVHINDHWEKSDVHIFVAGEGDGTEPPSRIGATHLLEHLLFEEETPKLTIAMVESLAKKHIKWNGYTSSNHSYITYAGGGRFRNLIIRQAHRAMQKKEFSAKTFEKERRNLLNELMDNANDNDLRLRDMLKERMYSTTRFGVTNDDLLQSTAVMPQSKVMEQYWRFNPTKRTIITIGPKKYEDISPLVEELFGSDKRRSSAATPATPLLEKLTDIFVSGIHAGKNVVGKMILQCPTDTMQDKAILYTITNALGRDDASILKLHICYNKGHSYLFSTRCYFNPPESRLEIDYSCHPNDAPAIEEKVRNALAALARRPLPHDKIKEHAGLTIIEFQDDMQLADQRAEWYLENELIAKAQNQPANYIFKRRHFEDLIAAVTPLMVQERLQQWTRGIAHAVLYPTDTLPSIHSKYARRNRITESTALQPQPLKTPPYSGTKW